MATAAKICVCVCVPARGCNWLQTVPPPGGRPAVGCPGEAGGGRGCRGGAGEAPGAPVGNEAAPPAACHPGALPPAAAAPACRLSLSPRSPGAGPFSLALPGWERSLTHPGRAPQGAASSRPPAPLEGGRWHVAGRAAGACRGCSVRERGRVQVPCHRQLLAPSCELPWGPQSWGDRLWSGRARGW